MSVTKGGSLIRGNDAARFASKTRVVGDCIEWTGSVSHNGYGKFMVGPAGGQRTWPAHRWSYLQAHGAVPELLRHKCDNPRCVRADHLEPGTQLQNVHDAMERGRRVVTLTPDLVRHFRSVRARGESMRGEAARLGLPYLTVYSAATGRTWRHIT